MNKFCLVLSLMVLIVSGSLFAQVNYHKSPNMIVVSGNSLIVPNTTITPSGITTNQSSYTLIPYSTEFSDAINHIFEHVDKTLVTTGLLREYGVGYTDITLFQGSLSSANHVDPSEWQAIYTTVYSYRCKYPLNLPYPAIVADTIQSRANYHNGGQSRIKQMTYGYSNATTHIISGLHYQYEQFKSNAVSSNLVSVSDGQIFDVSERPSSPYEIKQAFAFTVNHTWLTGSGHKFVIPSNLFFTNTGKAISTLQVNFDDASGFQTLSFDTPISIGYISDGVKTIRFKVTYTDSSVYEGQTLVTVTGTYAMMKYNKDNIQHLNSGQPFVADHTWIGNPAKANLLVHYGGNGDAVIDKPLIVVEAFDASKTLTTENRSLIHFLLDPQRGFSNFRLNPAGADTNPGTLADVLDDDDWDLFYIDFENGTDHLQDNAYVVEKIIAWINANKVPISGSTVKNVVIGASMGGLVGRWALRDMEDRSVDHDTRLFVAFDSPHLGANIPLSFQAFIGHVANIRLGFALPALIFQTPLQTIGEKFPRIGNVARLLDEPAVKQMAILSLSQDGEFTNTSSQHTDFLEDYRDMVPEDCRIIYISNGSQCGGDQGFSPLAPFLSKHADFSFALNADRDTDLRIDLDLKALPNQEVQKIYNLRVATDFSILGLIPISIELTDEEFFSEASQLPFDSGPGSNVDFASLSGGDFTEDLPFKVNIIRRFFNFVPTYSSLDVGGGFQTITLTDLNATYNPASPPSAPKNVPADNWITGTTREDLGSVPIVRYKNQIHVALSPRSARWLYTEIQGTYATAVSCSSECNPSYEMSLTGPVTVCDTNSSPYSFADIPTGFVEDSWSASGKDMISIVSTGSNSTVVTRGVGPSGFAYVRGTVKSVCGTWTAEKEVRVGPYSSGDYPVSGNTLICSNTFNSYSAPILLGATNYDWFWPAGWTYEGGEGTRWLDVTSGTAGSGNVVGVRVANACDTGGSPGSLSITVNSCGARISLYPNPATEEVDIDLEPEGDEPLHPAEILRRANRKARMEAEIRVVDIMQREVIRVKAPNKVIRIPVGSLPPGTYILMILRGTEIQNARLLIDRR